MTDIPNPWLTYSEAGPSQATGSAAAPDQPRSAAAVNIAEPQTMEVSEETPAVAAEPTTAGLSDWDINGTDCINEIFWFVRNKLLADPPRFVLNHDAFMADIEDPPLFLRRRA